MSKPAISKPVLTFFRRIVRGYFRRHFHGVRTLHAERFIAAGTANQPLILYANHGSWWDPMVCIFLADQLMSQRQHFAPMDAEALERYGILKHVGIFPVEMNTPRGAVQFLRTGEDILRGGGVLWITPQGQFVDSRSRPLEFKPGMSALATRAANSIGSCAILPLAIEYPFWNERLPECLLAFGEVIQVAPGVDATALQSRLVQALEDTMDELKSKAVLRDASEFAELGRGTAGTGGFYALGQRAKAFLLRRPYRAAHTAVKAAKEGR